MPEANAPSIRNLSRRITHTLRRKRDTPHGPGTDAIGDSEKHFAGAVSLFISTMHIKSVVELGCGDFRVGQMIARSGVRYTGVDGVESVVARNRERYESRKVRFLARDVIGDELPDGDLCLAGELFQHLTNAEIRLLLLKLKQYKYIIYSAHHNEFGTFIPNLDKPPGKATRLDRNSVLDLQKPPFNIRYVEHFITLIPDNPVDNHHERLCCFLIPMQDQATYLDPVYLD